MKKGEQTQQKIYEYIKKNALSSSTQISSNLGITTVAIYYHLKNLLSESLIIREGNTRSTRYRIVEEKRVSGSVSILHDVNSLLEMSKHTPLDDRFLESCFLELEPDGTWKSGLEVFAEKIKKEYQGKKPPHDLIVQRLVQFAIEHQHIESLRSRNGMFDGTESLRRNLEKYEKTPAINHLYFCQIAKIAFFGRMKTATQLFFGKQQHDKLLLEKAIQPNIALIQAFLKKNIPDALIFTPPTLARRVQFPDVLRDMIPSMTEIVAKKKQNILGHWRPQKELRGHDRITNAGASIELHPPKNLKTMKRIVIFDDNFTTGATINAIAEKIRDHGFRGNIIAITITGSFGYIPGDTDRDEV